MGRAHDSRERDAGAGPDEDRGRLALLDMPALVAGVFFFTFAIIVGPELIRTRMLSPHDRLLLLPLVLALLLVGAGWSRHRSLRGAVVGARKRVRELAAHDPLTGLLNRRGLAEQGSMIVSRSRRAGRGSALLMLGIDNFRAVNDVQGHAVGDALIRAAAQAITAALPKNALAARAGGDEFACLLTFDARHPEPIERLAEELVGRLTQPLDCDGTPLQVSASIGVARSDFGADTIDALIRSATIAMTAAKRGGRNRYAWFDRKMERDIQARTELEAGLRLAIPGQEIVPYFEPQIDLATGCVAGFEVLARWEHPQRGLIPPDTFIPIAEESGLIGEMSLAIMRQAFLAAADWHPALTLAVNISPHQLKDPWLAQKVIKTLTETGFPARRLEVELTESALFDNLALAQSIIGSLKNQGIRVALDDFGTGYSSLAHLRALPFDRIKIDKSFVLSLLDNADSLAIVKAIVSLGESLNLPVTAEGIETAALQDRVHQLGCQKGQGYLYGRPVGIANVRRLLAERRLLAAQQPVVEEPTSRRLAG